MNDAGMGAHLDAIGNVCGRYEGDRPGSAVPDAGVASRYRARRRQIGRPARRDHGDRLRRRSERRGRRLPFAIEVIGFADEEGVRFASTLLGSRAVAGTFDRKRAQCTRPRRHHHARGDGAVRSRSRAYRRGGARAARELLAYVELHIEQGPVLEQKNLPVGVVTAIAGATRLAVELTGMAGPRRHRADGAATRRAGGRGRMHARGRAICRAEPGLVGTVGHIDAHAGRHQCDPGQGRPSPSTFARRPTRTASLRSPIRAAHRGDRQAARACAAARRHP